MKFSAVAICISIVATALFSTAYAAVPVLDPVSAVARPKKNLRAFRSEYEFKSLIKKLKKGRGNGSGSGTGYGAAAPMSTTDSSAVSVTETVSVMGAAPSGEESVTNVQHAGVDEGGIVKVHGDHLVILRRGRLFTVSIKDSALRPVSSIDAFGAGIDPDGAWYDEMLISDDTIVVIGYSYERGGTEVGLFSIDREGKLKYRSTYHMRSNDYYSSRNYSSRLIGDKLIFYAPLTLDLDEENLNDQLPAVRRWKKGASEKDFKRIISPTNIYRGQRAYESDDSLALHTVTTCDLKAENMLCEASAVLGPEGNVFYVSPRSVYVWAVDEYADEDEDAKPILYRLPLDGAAPSALRVSGAPVDQFSFLESEDGHLNVLVRSESRGDGMWAAETSEGDVALMRVAVNSFNDGSVAVSRSDYRQLPHPGDHEFHNRFVGDYILYGTGIGWGDSREKGASLFLTKWNGTGGITSLPLPHGVDRIEQMGTDSIVIGTDGTNLHFSTVQLGSGPAVIDRYTFNGGAEGESRSHGFFYKPDSESGGILGLPVIRDIESGRDSLLRNSAAMMFLENRSLKLKPAGELSSQPDKAIDDDCKASCVDWYGNARPLFLRGRIFALLGYELVEGSMRGGSIAEVQRANFSPAGQKTARN